MTDVQPYVRYCHGCDTYDDAPRVHDIPDAMEPAGTKLYHYQLDCVPKAVYDTLPDEVKALVQEGHKDEQLRTGIVEVAKELPEPEPDEQPHLIAAGYTPKQIEAHLADAAKGN